MKNEYSWETDLSFGNLQTLLEVADSGSIAAAAKNTGKAVSSISRHLQQLENTFGCKLRENTGKTTRLSEEGEVLAILVRRQRLDFMSFSERAGGGIRSARIGGGDSLLHSLVLPKLGLIQNQFMSCRIRVIDMTTFDIKQALQNFSLDVGLLCEDSLLEGRAKSRQAGVEALDYRSLGLYSYSIYAPKSILSRGGITKLEDKHLAELPVAMIKNHWGRNFVALANERAGIDMNVRIRCETFTQVAELIRLSGYIGILPDFAGAALSPEHFSKIEPTFLQGERHNLVLAWNQSLLKTRSTTLVPFLDLLQKELSLSSLNS